MDSMRRVAIALLFVTAVAELVRQDLFIPSGRYPCFRQPALLAIPTANGPTLLAFAENRNVSACAPASFASQPPPNEVGSLQMRRSVDGGQTWGQMTSLFVGNIDFYTMAHASNGVTFLFLQQGDEVWTLTSANNGETWKPPYPLKLDRPPPLPFSQHVQPAVGHGITIDSSMCPGRNGCTAAGRLVLPFICVNGSAPHGDKGADLAVHSCVLISDDHGETWVVGGFGQEGTRESQLVQLHGNCTAGCLYLNERNFGEHPGHRLVARSTDAGESFGQYEEDRALVSPVTEHWTGIVGSVNCIKDPPDGIHRVVYSGPSNSTARSDVAVWISDSDARSWGRPKVVFQGPSGYSDLAALGDGDLGMILENGQHTFADRISFVLLPFEWLVK